METLTSQEFISAVFDDPAWASKLTTPTRIVGFVDMSKSGITHLSPHLHFVGDPNLPHDMKKEVANFENCKNLIKAEGNFHGFVTFDHSGIEEIGSLLVTLTDFQDQAASYRFCENLRCASGNYPGYVTFSHSGITHSENLVVSKGGKGNRAASLHSCPNLESITGTFNGFVSARDNPKLRDVSHARIIGKSTCTEHVGAKLDVTGCPNLTEFPEQFQRKEVLADKSLVDRLIQQRVAAKAALSTSGFEMATA